MHFEITRGWKMQFKDGRKCSIHPPLSITYRGKSFRQEFHFPFYTSCVNTYGEQRNGLANITRIADCFIVEAV